MSVGDLPICQDEQYHVLIVIFLELAAFGNGLFQQLRKVCWATKFDDFQYVPVLLDHVLNTIKIGVVDPTVDRETVVDFVHRV